MKQLSLNDESNAKSFHLLHLTWILINFIKTKALILNLEVFNLIIVFSVNYMKELGIWLKTLGIDMIKNFKHQCPNLIELSVNHIIHNFLDDLILDQCKPCLPLLNINNYILYPASTHPHQSTLPSQTSCYSYTSIVLLYYIF